jgi:hypothetical protein
VLDLRACDASCVGFFDDVPHSSDLPHQAGSLSPPIGEFPTVVAGHTLLLARTDAVAVGVTAIWAFETGFEFWLSSRFRHRAPRFQDSTDGQSLHIGLQFADGSRVANVGRVPEPVGGLTGPIMRPIGMGGGVRHRDRSYWVWPLPPAGPLTIVCEWPAFGIPETSTEIDTQPILRASGQVTKLWPENNR